MREEDLHLVSLSVDSSSAVRNNRPQSILAKRNGSAFYISPLFLLFSYFRLSLALARLLFGVSSSLGQSINDRVQGEKFSNFLNVT